MANVSLETLEDKYAISVESAPPEKPTATFLSFKMFSTILILSSKSILSLSK